MRVLRRLGAALLYRRAIRSLERIDQSLVAQNQILARLAQHFAPILAEGEPTPATAGVDYLNHTEAGLVLEYCARTRRETGRDPEEDEILRYLADEATLSLQDRLEHGR